MLAPNQGHKEDPGPHAGAGAAAGGPAGRAQGRAQLSDPGRDQGQ